MLKLKSLFNKLNISDKNSDKNSNLKNINHGNCSYCNEPFTEELWCKECDPFRMIEGWTSGNNVIDKFIKDTIYDARKSNGYFNDYKIIEWVPFNKFKDIKQIGEGGFAKVYSATWIDGKTEYEKQDDGSWKKSEPESLTVALKRLNGSQNMSIEYLNELKTHWNYNKSEFANKGNLRSFFLKDFNKNLWKDKIRYLFWITANLYDLHFLKYVHKDFHSGNILQIDDFFTYISDFGLSGPSNKQKSDDKICGVLPYIAPEVLNGEPYTLSSDIYSFGVIMTELSSGKPPFYNRKHDVSLALDICNGLRPEFGKGTPEIYKKLAYKCMNANSSQRPTAKELQNIIDFWLDCLNVEYYQEKKKYGYKGKEVKAAFEEADKEIPNISTSYKKNPDAIYTSRLFTFNNLTKPINSSIITSYLDDEENNEDNQDSQLVDLEVPSSLFQFKDDARNESSN
ncbi:kinase-like domain-containing protein [Rhizophagus clarus]|uniref:Kinase-like domain-containing protein n=1 Tax=Rhizophagus clarus TaxID=94130 RepID=A0A8H3KYI2_9GLOM|nr:kinase-like domain-containing protein [Rhizophagus clarus]